MQPQPPGLQSPSCRKPTPWALSSSPSDRGRCFQDTTWKTALVRIQATSQAFGSPLRTWLRISTYETGLICTTVHLKKCTQAIHHTCPSYHISACNKPLPIWSSPPHDQPINLWTFLADRHFVVSSGLVHHSQQPLLCWHPSQTSQSGLFGMPLACSSYPAMGTTVTRDNIPRSQPVMHLLHLWNSIALDIHVH